MIEQGKIFELIGNFSTLEGFQKLLDKINILKKHNEIISVSITYARGGSMFDVAAITYGHSSPNCSYIGTSTTNTLNGKIGYAKHIFQSTQTSTK